MKNDFLTFNEDTHQYFDPDGNEYISNSKLIASVSNPFEADKIAPFTAKKRDRVSKEQAAKFQVSQQDILNTYPEFERGITGPQVLQEWKDKNKKAIDRGNRIHKALEEYDTSRTNSKNNLIATTIVAISDFFKDYHSSENEKKLYSVTHKIAGTADKPCWRTRTRPGIVDIWDYKSNEIKYNSKYNNFLKGPVSHLEDCNFNKYCLQLSIYGVMMEEMTGCTIGQLGIIQIPEDHTKWIPIAVPYMKHEALALMAMNGQGELPLQGEMVLTEDIDW